MPSEHVKKDISKIEKSFFQHRLKNHNHRSKNALKLSNDSQI